MLTIRLLTLRPMGMASRKKLLDSCSTQCVVVSKIDERNFHAVTTTTTATATSPATSTMKQTWRGISPLLTAGINVIPIGSSSSSSSGNSRSGLRYASGDATDAAAAAASASAPTNKTVIDLGSLPEAPVAPQTTTELATTPVEEITTETINALGEPTFASIGLGGWSPVGLVQNCFEFLHVTWELPWWGTIVIGTIVVRTLIFPLVLIAQRNAAKMNNHMPDLQVLQVKMTEARQSGNAIESARYAQEMMLFMKEKQLNPFKNMVVPLAQAPLFISFFMGLRQMANTPVESMRDGGLFWFTDLTVADPTFILPLITSATLALTIEIGTDSAKLSAQNMQTLKYILRALPIAIFPFTMNFPAAILCYWASSNFISLGQVAILKIPAVREYFNIDKLITHKPESLPPKKGFVKGIKDSWQNMKISKELEERQRMDEIRFARAGKGPLVKTYKYDPTKSKTNPTTNPNVGAAPVQAQAQKKTN